MVAIPGYLSLSIISRTLAMSVGFVKQHPPTKKKKKHLQLCFHVTGRPDFN